MTETHSEMRPGTWQVPECPLLIEYQPSVMDEIRLAAVDAFFSLPRGGAEIGGVLYGRRAGSAVCIQAFRPIECEHAMGPTFVLSDKDKTRLQEQLDASAQDPLLAGLEIVGWYHTHTRSEIFLSDLDLEIYSRFFPESWHVALVVRPMGMKPTRAGFFFRERDRSVRSSASYHEFIVAPSGEARAGSTGRPEPAPAVARAAPGPSRRLLEAALEPQVEPPDTENGAAVPPTAPVVLQRIAAPPTDSPPVEAVQPMEVRPAEFVPPA